MRLLIVDDDPDQLHFLEKSFISLDGFDTYSAVNGREALEIYKAHRPFEVVLSDWQMPLMDGVALVREIRKINPQQHCILQTSEKGILIPGCPQLHKPYGLRQLMRLLRLPVQPLLF